MSELVFVYGTLLFPEVMRAVTGRAFPAEPARVEGFARVCVRGAVFPALVERPGAATAGRLCRGVDAASLARLDAFEGALYARRALRVRTDSGETVSAWAWVAAADAHGALGDEPWDPEAFARLHRAGFLATLGAVSFRATDPDKRPEQFRDFAADARPSVRELYRLNHRGQTLDFVRAKKAQYLPPRARRMGVWEAIEAIAAVVDDSDPDTDLSQLEHGLQTAEALRRDGKPRWMVLTGFVHDLGKVLCLYGEPQWAVVGDTFPVGCAFSPRIVFPELFAENPDTRVPEYSTRLGIYGEGCGLDRVHMSWGHDEYLYQVLRPHLPAEALAVVRYHSFYAAHREGDYGYLMNADDRRLMEVVREFNPYDLYSKSAERPDLARLRAYYEDLVAEFLPPVLDW
jgi:inositol oxygenase